MLCFSDKLVLFSALHLLCKIFKAVYDSWLSRRWVQISAFWARKSCVLMSWTDVSGENTVCIVRKKCVSRARNQHEAGSKDCHSDCSSGLKMNCDLALEKLLQGSEVLSLYCGFESYREYGSSDITHKYVYLALEISATIYMEWQLPGVTCRTVLKQNETAFVTAAGNTEWLCCITSRLSLERPVVWSPSTASSVQISVEQTGLSDGLKLGCLHHVACIRSGLGVSV
jgi:hypothetical protein